MAVAVLIQSVKGLSQVNVGRSLLEKALSLALIGQSSAVSSPYWFTDATAETPTVQPCLLDYTGSDWSS